MRIVGWQKMSFKSKDGVEINGYSLFYTEPFVEEAKNCVGIKADKVFVRPQIFEAFLQNAQKNNFKPLENEVLFVYNKYGKVEGILPR